MKGTQKKVDNHHAKVYRTEHYSESQVQHMRQNANEQEVKIARWYCEHPNHAVGPTHLHNYFFPEWPDKRGACDWPITSTRRAINNLTNTPEGEPEILIKTEETDKSLLGGTEHLWRWKKPEDFEQQETDPQPTEPEQMDAFGVAKPKSKGPYAEANR